MKHSSLVLGSLALALTATACSPGTLTGGTSAPINGNTGETPYLRLGGETGIKTVLTDFVGRVLKDPKINGYFLNAKVDGGRLLQCLVLQVGSLTGGPQTYPSMGCRDMKSSHAGLKISMNDFGDLAGHLVAALQAAKVAQADIDAIVKAVTPTAADIVEDKTSNGSVYQRVGRKPAIAAVVKAFITRVAADSRINGFFSQTDVERLSTCLVRQVCSVDGPCKYGEEVDGEPGVSRAKPCKDMLTAADFTALVEDLVAELDAAKVPAADKSALLGALGPLCTKIVAGGTGCP
jgi:truncated hemoglobin YjbI